MKKLIYIVLFTLLSACGYGQVYQSMPQYGYGPVKRFWVDSTLSIPTVCGTPTLKSYVTKQAAIAFDSCYGRLFYYNPKTLAWDTITGGVSWDTLSLSNRIELRLKISDTAAMLSPYLRRGDSSLYQTKYRSDTARSNIYNAIAGKLSPSDTLSLSGRIDQRVKYSDTAAMLSPYATDLDLALKVNISDTASMLSPYMRKADSSLYQTKYRTDTMRTNIYSSLNGKLTGSDTVSLSNRINAKIENIIRSSDSVYFYKNGIKTFAYLDSVGGGSSTGRFGNDTAIITMAKVHNDAGVTLTNGKVVYLASSGTSSDVPSVKLANNKADSSSANTLGFVSGTIAVNDTGWVITGGKIEDLNTNAFANGDIIYLDSVSGNWTKTKPVAPYHMVYLGAVVKANPGNGSIFVKVQNGYELDEIHDVKITSKLNNQILVYSDTQGLWKNRNVYSVVDTTNVVQTKYKSDTARNNTYSTISGLNLQKITDVGNTTTNDIKVNDLYIWDNSYSDHAKINISDDDFAVTSATGNTLFLANQVYLRCYKSPTISSTIYNGGLTKVRSYDLPDTSGTFALRGDSTLYQTKYRSDTARTNTYTALNGKQSTLTWGTGLTNTSGTISSNLSTGVSGGQSVIGGTASGNSLTLSSTSNATKGKILFGTSAYDEVNNRLGIGTTSPSNNIDIITEASYPSMNVTSYGVTGTIYSPSIGLLSSRGTLASPTAIQNNDRIGLYVFRAHNGTDFFTNSLIGAYADGNQTSTSRGGYFTFETTANGTTSRTEKLRIVGNGNILIGTTTDAGYKLDVNGTARIRSTQTTAGNIYGFAAKTGAYTITGTDNVITGDATSAAFDITLPTAASKSGQVYTIKKIDSGANAVTVNTTSSQTIDGSATYSLGSQWKYVSVVSNGSNWLIIANN